MNVGVIGSGRWGTFLAWYQNRIGNKVMLKGLKGDRSYEMLVSERRNDYMEIPDSMLLTSDLKEILAHADTIIISVGSQVLRKLMQEIILEDYKGKTFILCMKGLETSTGKRLSQIAKEYLKDDCNLAVWVGPGHVQSFIAGIPNCMIIDSENPDLVVKLANMFNSELIRFYYGNDLIGTEIGAASKNVMGIAAGMLDGLNLTSMKGSLMARGVREISRLVERMGGNPLTPYGLSHLGDYEATLFSENSHNRMFGEKFIKGEKFEKLAEGVYTAEAIHKISKELDVECPICESVYQMVYKNKDVKETINELFTRNLKKEFID